MKAGPGTSDRVGAMERGHAALARLAGAADAVEDPLVVVALADVASAAGQVDPGQLLDWLDGRHRHHGRDNALRYRWGLSWRSEPGSAAYRPDPGRPVTSWRPAERDWFLADPSAYGRRLMEPITIASHLRYWGGLAAHEVDTETGARAAALLDEALPAIEDDVARWFQARDPWRDTFGLWLLTAEPQAVGRLRDLLFSLAIRYGGIASRDGVVRGTRHPFYGAPLTSASACLASGLWRTGVYPTVIPSLLDLLTATRSPEGSWADGDQPPDVMTTLAAADILARLDPDYDPAVTVGWFVRQQEHAGWWRALGPEVPWLTAAVLEWLGLVARPFPDRFTWPSTPVWVRDRLTGLTTVAALDELGNVFEGLPSLGRQAIEVAFLDLAGFGRWNSEHGQSRGDDLMRVLGSSLMELPGTLPVRIGGDEFIVLGKPGATGLIGTLDHWLVGWPATLAASAMPASVAPRVVVSRGPARSLRALRRRLGDEIGPLKRDVPDPPAAGVLREIASD